MITITIPYSLEKNLGKEYNRIMTQIPENEWACMMDYDAQLLTPDAGAILHKYAELNPDCLLTCLTNRIHTLSPQLLDGVISENADIRHHVQIAEERKTFLYKTIPIKTTMSGFLMLFPRSLWEKHKFNEDGKCLGVDSEWTDRLIKAGEKILLCQGLYVFHQYRIMTHIKDKSHLQ